jgi:two-component system, OmpR family, sensor kinase
MTSLPRRLGWPRRAQLRTRVLAAVLLVTVAALTAFDFAAVAALRGYLLNQTDAKPTSVMDVGQVIPAARQWNVTTTYSFVFGRKVPARAKVPSRRHEDPAVLRAQVSALAHRFGHSARPSVAGYTPATRATWTAVAAPPVLNTYRIVYVSGNRSRVLLAGPGLQPRMPAIAFAQVARARGSVTVNGLVHNQLRLRAVRAPGGYLLATTSLAQVNSIVARLARIVIFGSIAAGLLVSLIVFWVMRRGLRPIETMAAQADQITAGNLTDRVTSLDPRSEVGRLGLALNGMLARIEASVAEREASQELTRRFFADASHELRNPLASLRANAELYQQGALSRRLEVDEAMRRIALEAQRMSGLVDDMLGLARLDQHPGQQHERVDLTALVTECADRARIAYPHLFWHQRIAAGLVTQGDGELLRRALDNLLANVHAHTPEGTVATITAARRGSQVIVEVSDTGPGVPPGQLPRIFDRFYRGEAPAHRPGSGLGLAIVTAIAAAHDGTADAAVNDPHGLRITLTLPAAPVRARALAALSVP